MNEELERELVLQYYRELDNEMLYRVLSSISRKQELDGFTKLFREQADEEHKHGMKLYEYLLDRRVVIGHHTFSQPVLLPEIQPKDMIDLSYQREQQTTTYFKKLYELAERAKDTQTIPLLDWYIEEQTEEENKFRRILRMFASLRSSSQKVFLINTLLQTFK